MNRISLFVSALALSFTSSIAGAQDFSISEMIQMRSSSLSTFETMAMAKGYQLSDIDKEFDHFATFKKGRNTISYGLIKNDHFTQIDTSIIYITVSEDEYNKLKGSVKENPKHKNKTHFFKNETHILHVNMDNDLVAHFFTKFNNRALYEIEVTTREGDKYKPKH